MLLKEGIQIFNDGCSESLLPNKLSKLLATKQLLNYSANTTKTVSFTGFIFIDITTYIFLPKSVALLESPEYLKNVCSILLRTLQKFHRQFNSNSIREYGRGLDKEDIERLTEFSTHIEVIENWRKYGAYNKRHLKQFHSNLLKGKINWQRTVKTIQPFISKSGVPHYPKFNTTTSHTKEVEAIVKIQKWCVAIADEHIGWMLSHNSSVLFPELSYQTKSPPFSLQQMIAILKNELKVTFDERITSQLNSLLRFVLNDNLYTQQVGEVFGVKNFWVIWENILKKTLNDESKQYLHKMPQPVYYDEYDNKVSTNKIRQIPDIIIGKEERELFFLDAKYYNVDSSLPGWSDIVKQLFYAQTYTVSNQSTKATTAFIFPKPININKNPRYVAVISPDKEEKNNQNLRSQLGIIHCIYCDVIVKMQQYLDNEIDNDLRDYIINQINEQRA